MSNLVIANFTTGFETDKAPFLINNDAFPEINNAFVWRDRVKKKRGSSLLGRLQRNFTAMATGQTTDGAGAFTGNLIAILGLEANSTFSTTGFSVIIGADVFTDTNPATGVLTGSTGGTGTFNYATGDLTILGAPINTAITVTFGYYPDLAVMGIRQFNQNFTGASTPDMVNFPLYVFFDTKYSYLYTGTTGPFYDVNLFFGTGAHFLWSGQDYQQFWTANYQGAMFATNNVPGFNFKALTNTLAGAQSVIQTSATTVTIGLTAHGLSTDVLKPDSVFINEVVGFAATTAPANQQINGQSGLVTVIDANSFTLTVAGANFQGGATGTGGIAQFLTRSIVGKDGIKYFIGDPSSGATTKGWVNFSPPLSNAPTPSYLVGAKLIIAFKNRLLFFATWTQTSGAASATYNPNQLISCQNGTVFYANVGLPPNQTADPTSFYQNVVGKGLRLNAPISQEIICASENNDVVIVIFENRPLKLYSTGDDSAPFLYQTISTEFGAMSTFSAVPLDAAVLSIGPYGFALTDQTSARRFDLPIPDQVFNIRQDDHGINRVCSIRDWRNEFVYFTFPTNANSASNSSQNSWKFPTTTLAFNYRENIWSTFTENYTAYGQFKYSVGYTWATLPFRTWAAWHNPWNFGATQSKYPFTACGNQQGFVLLKQEDTQEDQSQYIKGLTITGTGLSTIVTITSPSHNLNDGDYIIIKNAIGVANVNGVIFSISVNESLPDTFTLFLTTTQQLPANLPAFNNAPINAYVGGGTYSRLTNINILTKQFPVGWQEGRQTRLGTQRYFLTTTTAGQISANLYVSQNNNLSANSPEYSPYLPFTNVLLTCFEGNDLNLTQGDQDQIWHRINTSVNGDTIQVGFTLSDGQMRDPNSNQEEIELFAIVLSVAPGPVLAF